MRKAQADLHTLQQGLSPDDIKKVKETKEKISTELTSLTGSLEKASKDLTDSQEAVARLDCDASNNDELKNNKENLEKNIATVGDILKKLEEVYGQQLEMAKSDADKASLDLAAVRERWREAKDDVTNAQAENKVPRKVTIEETCCDRDEFCGRQATETALKYSM
jgi:archaellum component FlaC